MSAVAHPPSERAPRRALETFLAGGGEMGELIRAYDWAASPLGPPSDWPLGLTAAVRLMLSSLHPMIIWWGADLIQLYNDAYRGLIGPEIHPSGLGQRGAECWAEIWSVVGPQVEHVMAGRGGTWQENQMVPVTRNGRRAEAYWTYSYNPIASDGASGGVGGVLVICAETTATVRATIELRRSHARQEFRIALADALRGLADPAEIMAVASESVGRHLSADQANFYVIDGGDFIVEREWSTQRTPSMVGRHKLADFGAAPARARSGEVLRVEDSRTDEGVLPFADRSMIAFMSAPVFRNRDWVAGLHVHQATPRVWRDDEAALVLEVAERVWSEIERRRAVAALAASESRYKALVTGVGPIVFRAAPDGNMIEAPGWETRTGQNFQDYRGFGWLDAVHPDDRDRMAAEWLASLDSGRPIHSEYRTATKSGGWRWADGYAVPVTGEDGRIVEWIGTVTDIHDRRLAEQALRESEARFRQLAESIEEVFYVTDIDAMKLVYLSPAFEKTWGRPVEWLLEDVSRLLTTLHPDDRQALLDVREARLNGQPGQVEFRIIRPDGAERWIFDRTFPVKVDGYRWSAGLAEDITERKRIEAELRALNINLEQRVAEEVAERSKAEDALRQSQKLEAIGQLTGGVAHDFNNLLTVIRSSADLLRRPGLTEERRRRFVDAISDTADRAARLTSQLLAFSRRQALSPRVFDAAAQLAGITEMLESVLGSRIAVELDIAESPATVEADVNQFETALVNLAANARDAMNGQGTLRIRLSASPPPRPATGDASTNPSNDFLAVSVIDTGCGIPLERQTQIFEPFFTTKQIGQGTGLGLSQVYGFARQSGGEVTVDSAPGLGATFTIYLPRSHKPLAALDTDAEIAGDAGPAQGCVLVVEDNREVGEFSMGLLEELGYGTVLASSGEEALALLEEDPGRFDVILSDVVMPGMGGIALGREVRRRLPAMPFVLTTGFSSALAEDGAHGFELLRKPYSVESLSRILRRAKCQLD